MTDRTRERSLTRRTVLKGLGVGAAGVGSITSRARAHHLTAPFTEEFSTGLNSWTIDLHEDALPRVSKGEGSWSEKYGGSLRLHVDGGPNHIGVYHAVDGLRKGTKIISNYESPDLAGANGGPRIRLHLPNSDEK